MPMTAREQAIKRHFTEQLEGNALLRSTYSGLSYAEKKHVIEELNPDFLDAELRKMRKRGNRLAITIGLLYGVLAVARITTSFRSGSVTEIYVDGAVDMLLLIGGLIAAYMAYLTHKARLFTYEGLRILAGSENEAAKILADGSFSKRPARRVRA